MQLMRLRWTLRARMAAAGGIAVAIVAVSLATLSQVRLEKHANEEFERLMELELSDFVHDYQSEADPTAGFDFDLAQRLIAAEKGELYIVLLDASGRELARSADLPLEDVPLPDRMRTRGSWKYAQSDTGRGPDGPMYRVLTLDVRSTSRDLGYLQGLMSREGTNRILARSRRTLVLLVPLATLAGAILSFFLAHRALTPLRNQTRIAERIGPANLDERLPVEGSDEVGRIAVVLNGMLDRLEFSFRSLQSFSSDASHQMRTPLTIMRGELETATRTSDPEVMREAMIASIQEIDDLSSMTEGLLTLARLGSGRLPQWAPIDCQDMLADLLEDAEVLAEANGLTFTRPAPAPDVIVLGDRILLRQAIWNLLDNAIQHTESGGSIAVDIGAQDGTATIAVRDSGEGIAESERNRIFEPFYRGSGAHPSSGHGLGLALAHRIVECHAGRITVRCEPDLGAEFAVHLPLESDAESDSR